jgi:alpha-1,3/alpha-1,6-mannosyltransferase
MAKLASSKKLRIGFVHPDIGIGKRKSPHGLTAGGAERLVVDAAVALQNLGHEVVMFTSRHDPARCFEETRNGKLRTLSTS